MNKRLCAFVLLIVAGSGSVLLACGDKFLNHNLPTRFHLAALREPATILIYSNPVSEIVVGASVDTTLSKAGYRPTTVTNSTDFQKALTAGGWDLVLVSLSDAATLSQRLPANVAVVPLAFKATESELKQAKKLYKVVLKAPTKSQAFLEAIDEALASRPKASRKAI
jgi:hypothetical protein